jgi:uncharacterized coiled-coil protein SlyX
MSTAAVVDLIYAFFLFLPLGWGAEKLDSAALVRSLQEKTAGQERTISELRTQLDQSRSQAAGRFDRMRATLESLNRTLQSQLDQAKVETYTARTVSASKDTLVQQLTAELDKTRSNSSTTAVAAAVQDTALKTAVQVATVRHAQDATALKKSAELAGVAANNSAEAVRLSGSLSDDLEEVLRKNDRLKDILNGVNGLAKQALNLMVILAVMLVAIIAAGIGIYNPVHHFFRRRGPAPVPAANGAVANADASGSR